MLKKSLYFLLIFGMILTVIYTIFVPKNELSTLYQGKKSDLEELHSFRTIPTKSLTIDDKTEKAIRLTIENYFEGRKRGDIALLQKAFHGDAKLMTTTAIGERLIIPLKDYLVVVQKEGAVKCTTELLSLIYEGRTATATTLFDYGDKAYLDTLSLSKIDKGWQIMLKKFSKK